MNNKQAKKLRRLATQLTKEGVPYDGYVTTNIRKMVMANGEEVLTATFSLGWGTTKNIYNQLKASFKGKPLPVPYMVKQRILEEEKKNAE